ncbi:hypothetical protein DMB66_17660 [Actinoplanes sp. ATCC 53533]|uniref:hypothetical protein n=1 Tax=Actinoplanes sp. ATCC 53533 TaxID=1288362 RepID=UPI000F7ACF25|nr:hypothetical protein [Actinoplanes sp. ATCC 53533]RSM65104.1 hypothetical protein DMB66_17660 [Actinoplanes sp. ATCC 53533]
MPTDLYFDLAPAVRLAEHALAAPGHAADPAGLSAPDIPALWLVTGDDGIWLASNGLPGLAVDVLDPAAGASRVFAHGWAPGDPALPGRLATLDLRPVTVIGVLAEPIDVLPDLLRAGHRRLRLTVDGAWSTVRVDDPRPDDITGEPTDPVTNWLQDALGQTVTGRPWRADLGHQCRAHAGLARLLDKVADAFDDQTSSLLAITHDLSQHARDAATDLARHGWTSTATLPAQLLAQHDLQSRHEVLRNLLAQLYATWHDSRTGSGCCRPVSDGDQTTAG